MNRQRRPSNAPAIGMKYQVVYRADGWETRAPHRLLPHAAEECQIVRRELENGRRLYVELARLPDEPVRVLVARLEVFTARSGRQRYRTVEFLQPHQLELIELPATAGT